VTAIEKLQSPQKLRMSHDDFVLCAGFHTRILFGGLTLSKALNGRAGLA
jgi:hypothetical protein